MTLFAPYPLNSNPTQSTDYHHCSPLSLWHYAWSKYGTIYTNLILHLRLNWKVDLQSQSSIRHFRHFPTKSLRCNKHFLISVSKRFSYTQKRGKVYQAQRDIWLSYTFSASVRTVERGLRLAAYCRSTDRPAQSQYQDLLSVTPIPPYRTL